MSFKPEFCVGGEWSQNAVRFATREEAERNAQALFMSWTVPSEWRVTESTDPVNYRIGAHGRDLIAVEPESVAS